MARLAHQRDGVRYAASQPTEKAHRIGTLKWQAWRQLRQQHTQLSTKARNFREKPVQGRIFFTNETAFVREFAWNLDGESEAPANAVCPPGIGLLFVVPVKGAVYFSHRETASVAFEVAATGGNQG